MNVTVNMDDGLVEKARLAAARENLSLSKWMADAAKRKLYPGVDLGECRKELIAIMKSGGLDLGGERLSREELHERGVE